jgi:chromosome segregation ATPase
VNYDEFNTEYAKVLDKIQAGRSSWSELSGHVTRLRQATAGITTPAERTQVASDLAALSQMVDMSRRTNDKEDVWTVTSDAIRRASSQEGSVADRIGRIDAAINDITSLASRNPDEREALMQSTSTLRILHSSLQASLRTEQAEAAAAH